MATTLSLMSSWLGSIRSRVRILLLEFQSRFSRSVRHGADTPVIQETAAVEHHALDTLLDRALGDHLADRFGAFEVAAACRRVERSLHRRFDGRGRHERFAGEVVDDLRIDVGHAPEHAEARSFLGARNPFALAELTPAPPIVFRLDLHNARLKCPDVIWLRSFRLSSSRPHPYTGHPFACTDPACADDGCWRPPVRQAGGLRRLP